MNAVQRRMKMSAELHPNALRYHHIRRWKAMSRLRDCLTPLIQAAFNAGREGTAQQEKEIARLRREIVDYTYIAQYTGEAN